MRSRIIYGKKKRFFLDDREVTREEYDAAVPNRIADLLAAAQPPAGQMPAGWPMTMDALAVRPKQIAEAMERDRLHGVPTNYTPQGDPIITDRGHRRDYVRMRGCFDRNAGYGDPSPTSRSGE